MFRSSRFAQASTASIFGPGVPVARPIPITDPRMTRFWWTVENAADFVIEHMLEPGLHIPPLQGRSVLDIINSVAPDDPTVEIGIQPGEKLHEMLETLEENPEARSSAGAVGVGVDSL